jgi:hypothetical protein
MMRKAKRSKNVDNAIKALYATLATAAAKKALASVEADRSIGADVWMADFIRWIEQAGSNATQWYYNRPRASK